MADSITNATKRKRHAECVILGILVFALFCVIAIQVGPDPSQATHRIDTVDSSFRETSSHIKTMDSGFKEVPPRIEAICISGSGESSVYASGEFARKGDIIDGFKILKIHPNKVEFEKNGKTVVGIFPPAPKLVSLKSNNLLREPVSSEKVGYKSSDNSYKQYRQFTYSKPLVGENGSHYGQISEDTGRPKTVYVRGYYRKDGTYVRSHYRSPPRK